MLHVLELELQMILTCHMGAGELNLGPLQMSSVLITTEPSLQLQLKSCLKLKWLRASHVSRKSCARTWTKAGRVDLGERSLNPQP